MTYVFFISMADDTTIEWRGLTKDQAKRMYDITNERTPAHVVSFGWDPE